MPCQKVDSFRLSPTLQEDRFSYAERMRQHIQSTSLDPGGFVFNTERLGSPHTFVIRKTDNGSMRVSPDWLNGIKDLKSHLVSMRNGYVFDLVGGDIYQIAGLDDALKGDMQKPLQPVSASKQNHNHALAVLAGMKREADVIDLTGFDS
jgi:hypothetical protein